MALILGLDLGTASIGFFLRDTDKGTDLLEQFISSNTIKFTEGVGRKAEGEFSYAGERTKKRSTRNLYKVRKYRRWTTLKVLIDFGYCPLTIQDLEEWSKYDKSKDVKHRYPIHAIKFQQWIKLDFDGDGKPDYTSPYQLREELATKQFDFTQEINRYKLGRCLYHIARRRGFKSNKGETLKELEQEAQKNNVEDINTDTASLKASEEKKAQDLTSYMEIHNLPTVGCAFARLERDFTRVRESQYQAVRTQYKDEIKYIFNFQKGLDINGEFFKRIYSDKKDGTIFYVRPLRSQKGVVGKCTLEPTKPRCPISHPEFEKYRAFCFINNIQYRKSKDEEWQILTAEQKLKLYHEKFLKTSNFRFESIRTWLEKEIGLLEAFHLSKKNQTINYEDSTYVTACPISARMKSLFGEDWESYTFETDKTRTDTNGKSHTIVYTIEDIWHICFSYEDEDAVISFAQSIGLRDKQIKQFVNLWIAIPQGYANLSLKAIRNINRFLVPKSDQPLYHGLIYSHAVLLAKIPDLIGEEIWKENEHSFMESLNTWIVTCAEEKQLLHITNNLISAYKALGHTEQFAYKDYTYQLQDSDKDDVKRYIIESFKKEGWNNKDEKDKERIIKKVEQYYQDFFASSSRDYYHLPQIGDSIKQHLAAYFPELQCKNDTTTDTLSLCNCSACKKLKKLYHPSITEIYKPAKDQRFEYNGVLLSKKLLESPATQEFRNPVVMRVLHQLRHLINYLLKEGQIDENTRIVVEVARELNDANMRWAIKEYDQRRKIENEIIRGAVKELQHREISKDESNKVRLSLEQNPDYVNDTQKSLSTAKKEEEKKKEIKKYRLWLEQGMMCLYTGQPISLSKLLDDNCIDIEHTIPLSRSFDNSLANQTVCYAHFNRSIKGNKMPTELSNYEEIKLRLSAWEKKVEQLKSIVEYRKYKSQRAITKDAKDAAIQQKHLYQIYLDYWKDKLSRFTMTSIPEGFKHRQLNDTKIITKYAYHYLKSVFNQVDVQKGAVTAEFRKILGITKNRENHSNHAIDAMTLSLIPSSAKREEILKLFYEIQEEKKLGINYTMKETRLQEMIKSCHIKGVHELIKFIEEHILVKHISKDQTLTPAIRRKRINGKIQWKRDKQGNICLDEKGNRIPQEWRMGDCLRGEIHQDSFYGAIKQKKDASHQTTYGEISYVIRKKLKSFKNVEALHKVIVDENVYAIIKKQCEEKGMGLEKANQEGIYMLNKKGEKANKIRHVRCYAKLTHPLDIKQHSHLSNKDYKQSYHVQVGNLFGMCRYYNADKSTVEYRVLNLFDICKNRKSGYDIAEIIEIKRQKFYLDTILLKGKLILLYDKKEDPASLRTMSTTQLSDRLYCIKGFETDGRINLVKHLYAHTDERKTPIKTFDALPEYIRQSINKVHFLLEDVDFKLTYDGKIIFL